MAPSSRVTVPAVRDTLIGLDRFRAPIAGAPYAIILLYWAGQLGLALSVREPVCTTIDQPVQHGGMT